jgi:dynein light intermediate chain 1
LTRNLGLDLIVVVTKTDYMIELEKDFDYKDEHYDFIQQAVSLLFYLIALFVLKLSVNIIIIFIKYLQYSVPFF